MSKKLVIILICIVIIAVISTGIHSFFFQNQDKTTHSEEANIVSFISESSKIKFLTPEEVEGAKPISLPNTSVTSSSGRSKLELYAKDNQYYLNLPDQNKLIPVENYMVADWVNDKTVVLTQGRTLNLQELGSQSQAGGFDSFNIFADQSVTLIDFNTGDSQVVLKDGVFGGKDFVAYGANGFIILSHQGILDQYSIEGKYIKNLYKAEATSTFIFSKKAEKSIGSKVVFEVEAGQEKEFIVE